MNIEELYEFNRHIMSLLEVHKGRKYTRDILRGYRYGYGYERIYEEFLNTYTNKEYMVTSKDGWDEVFTSTDKEKGWRVMIKENHWCFNYVGLALGIYGNKAYIREYLHYYPSGHENIIEWECEESAPLVYTDNYKVMITSNGEFIEEHIYQ